MPRSDQSATSGLSGSFEDANFVVGDSPAVHDCIAKLGRPAHGGTIVNDGAGSFTIELSDDGTNYGDTHTIVQDEIFHVPEGTYRIRVTWIADSAYRIAVI